MFVKLKLFNLKYASAFHFQWVNKRILYDTFCMKSLLVLIVENSGSLNRQGVSVDGFELNLQIRLPLQCVFNSQKELFLSSWFPRDWMVSRYL